MSQKKHIAFSPLVILSGCFIGGAILAEYIHTMTMIWMTIGIVFCIISLFLSRKAATFSLMLAMMAMGAMRMNVARHNLSLQHPGEMTRLTCRVSDVPEHKGDRIVMSAKIIEGNYKNKLLRLTLRNEAMAISPNKGDTLFIFNKLYDFKAISSKDFPKSNFNYPLWAKTKGYFAHTTIYSLSRIKVTGKSSHLDLQGRLLKKIEKNSNKKEETALIKAITLGYKKNLSEELKENFRNAGVSHLLALSGMHMSIIFGILAFFLIRPPFRKLGTILTLTTLWIYTMIVGMPPSAVRAAIMISMLSLGLLLQSSTLPINNLCIAALAITAINPYSVFDVGFQLSFVAMFGIVIINMHQEQNEPRFEYKVLEEAKCGNKLKIQKLILKYKGDIKQALLISVAAQIMTTPLVLYHFGIISIISIFSTLILAPLLTIMLYASIALLICPTQWMISAFILQMAHYLAETMIAIASLFAKIPFATYSVSNPPSVLKTICLYILLFSLSAITYRLLKIVKRAWI